MENALLGYFPNMLAVLAFSIYLVSTVTGVHIKLSYFLNFMVSYLQKFTFYLIPIGIAYKLLYIANRLRWKSFAETVIHWKTYVVG